MTIRHPSRPIGFSDVLSGLFGRSAAGEARRGIEGDPEAVRDELAEVYAGFEALVETLCDVAQFGPSDNLQLRYERGRAWLNGAFARLRPFVGAYLRPDPADTAMGMRLIGRPVDAFEALVLPDDVHAWLEADDGEMVSRIVRGREALTLYGEHLRLLSTVRR